MASPPRHSGSRPSQGANQNPRQERRHHQNPSPLPVGRLPLPNRVKADACLRDDSHTGLWFERFFDGYDEHWRVGQEKTVQTSWLQNIVSKQRGDAEWMKRQAEATRRRIEALGGRCLDVSNDGVFVTGMGLAHPLENGLVWHPALGAPYLNGAAVKGLLRHFLENWTEVSAAELDIWLGRDEDKDKGQSALAGQYIFFDALPLKPVRLCVDIMTPHYDKWYVDGNNITGLTGDANVARLPADWHSPVPVPFLAVSDIALRFAIAPRKPASDNATEVMDNLLEGLKLALQWLGAGSKTAAGYGRFNPEETQPCSP